MRVGGWFVLCERGGGGGSAVFVWRMTVALLPPLLYYLSNSDLSFFFLPFRQCGPPSVLFLHGGERDQVDGVSMLAKGY